MSDRRTPSRPGTSSGGLNRVPYLPGLDGLRAIAVVGVMIYHANHTWLHGGFLGVEVFFVISGYLITLLLLGEDERDGGVNLRQFWLRRARRLLPALYVMMAMVAIYIMIFYREVSAQVRGDFLAGILYVSNWYQIIVGQGYASSEAFVPLRHLWSLAVEEQFYFIWPLVMVAILRRARHRLPQVGLQLFGASLTIAVAVGLLFADGFVPLSCPTDVADPNGYWHIAGRCISVNDTLYLGSFSRAGGLLLGAGFAMLWRPMAILRGPLRDKGRQLDLLAFVGLAALGWLMWSMYLLENGRYNPWLFRGGFLLAGVVTLMVVAAATHQHAATGRLLGNPVFNWIGTRSYGLYLYHWPIYQIIRKQAQILLTPVEFVVAMVATVLITEASYRFIETPIRKGALGRWWHARERTDWRLITACGLVTSVVLVGSLFAFYRSAAPTFDAALDTSGDVSFDPNAALGAGTTVPPTTAGVVATDPAGSVAPTAAPTTTAASVAPPVTAATLPRTLVIVGDSTAYSLWRNLPSGIESTFVAGDGSVEGCSVYDSGKAVSSRDGYTRNFSSCAGWDGKWKAAAQRAQAEVGLVVIGAWDVFDVTVDGKALPFRSKGNDARFTAGVQRGIDALTSTGAKVALLEVPCMRPQDVKGAGVPALPERGMDDRVVHLNDLLRRVAAANKDTTTFVTGPAQYCSEPIASDRAYRWDGVHAYKPGAKLTMEAIAQQLLSIPVG